MTDTRVIKATYADWKPVKTRAALQIILEVPIEQTEAVMKMLGVPIPGQEKWVAVALLDVAAVKTEKKRWGEMSRAQQAGILCADPQFQEWAATRPEDINEEAAAKYVRKRCGVTTRAHLDTQTSAMASFAMMVGEYRRATGQEAEQRQ